MKEKKNELVTCESSNNWCALTVGPDQDMRLALLGL
jgi:hypothetical protein